MDTFLAVPPTLSPRSKEFISVIYGQPRTVPISDTVIEVSAPDEIIENAQKYLDRAYSKGFTHGANYRQILHPHFRKHLAAKKAQSTSETESIEKHDIESICSVEPDLRFWLGCNAVTRIHHEIDKLPYHIPGDEIFAISKLYDMAAATVRQMKHERIIDPRKDNPKQLRHAMRVFVLKMREVRHTLITSQIQQDRIEIDRLTTAQKEEFIRPKTPDPDTVLPTDIPPQNPIGSNNNIAKNDNAMLLRITQNVNRLPEIYRVHELPEEEDVKKQRRAHRTFLNEISPAIMKAVSTKKQAETTVQQVEQNTKTEAKKGPRKKCLIIAKPLPPELNDLGSADQKASTRKMSDQEAIHHYWNQEDPLRRTGQFVDTLSDMADFARDFELDAQSEEEEIPDPFPMTFRNASACPEKKKKKLLRAKRTDSLSIIDKIWNTADVIGPQIADAMSAEQQDADILNVPNFGYAEKLRNSEALRYLTRVNIAADESTNTIHTKLNEIWAKLGFTIHQKLELLLKYSKTPDDSSKLAYALGFWEQSFEAVTQYHNAYKNLKDFFRFEAKTSTHLQGMIAHLTNEVSVAEDAVNSVANVLKLQYGDDLIIKCLKYFDFIAKRKGQIAVMLQPYEGLI